MPLVAEEHHLRLASPAPDQRAYKSNPKALAKALSKHLTLFNSKSVTYYTFDRAPMRVLAMQAKCLQRKQPGGGDVSLTLQVRRALSVSVSKPKRDELISELSGQGEPNRD